MAVFCRPVSIALKIHLPCVVIVYDDHGHILNECNYKTPLNNSLERCNSGRTRRSIHVPNALRSSETNPIYKQPVIPSHAMPRYGLEHTESHPPSLTRQVPKTPNLSTVCKGM
jgi:hypothetical protein